jgi:hypothetical protein
MIRRARTVGMVVATALAASACGPRPDPVTGVTPDDAVLYVRTNLADADLVLDGHFVGRVGLLRGGVAVSAGVHHLELRDDCCWSSYLEVTLARAERRKVTMELLPILP